MIPATTDDVTNSNEIEQLHHREEVMGTIVTFDLYVRTSASRAAQRSVSSPVESVTRDSSAKR